MLKNDVTDMTRYETRLQAQGFHLLAGVDEVTGNDISPG